MNAILLEVLRDLYALSLIAVVISTIGPAYRSFTRHPLPKDFDYMLFCWLAINRLWLLLWIVRSSPDTAPYQEELLAAFYILGTAVESGVVLSRWWHTHGRA